MSDKGALMAQLAQKKPAGEKIVVVTAYDYPLASLADQAGVDLLLVGDSLGMVVAGHRSTMPVTLDDMIYHTQMVVRGAKRAPVVADLTYGSYQVSVEQAVSSSLRLIKEGGADAVKLECTQYTLPAIRRLTQMGIPVMGHIGLLPQTAVLQGGFRTQGKDEASVWALVDLAVDIEEAGAFSMVLECVTAEAARLITEKVDIPTIGIGAGAHCDGQVLVSHDLLGLTQGHVPHFVKQYAQVAEVVKTAFSQYAAEVRDGSFPDRQHSSLMDEEEARKLL